MHTHTCMHAQTHTHTHQFIYYFWESTPAHSLWHYDTSVLHYILVTIHVASWISIACSVFAIDYLELLGIKQVSGHCPSL